MLEAEDHYEGERKDLTGRLEALDSIVRMLELKHKNSLDHASRLEERENELKKVSSLNNISNLHHQHCCPYLNDDITKNSSVIKNLHKNT